MAHHLTLGIAVWRAQLRMFISGPMRQEIERVRALVDPVQSALIPAHVTLCREDEFESLSPALIASRLEAQVPIVISFGTLERLGGHGIILRCSDGMSDYAELRKRVLGSEARQIEPHITLAHPRNPMAPGNSIEAASLALPISIRLDVAMLIAQDIMNARWRVTHEFRFGGRSHA